MLPGGGCCGLVAGLLCQTSLLLKCTVDLDLPGVDPYYGEGHVDLASRPQ
jgi:hypothetical protein